MTEPNLNKNRIDTAAAWRVGPGIAGLAVHIPTTIGFRREQK